MSDTSSERGPLRSRLAASALVVAVAVLLAVPWLKAWLEPPAGRAFAGAFLYQDDHLQYLSFVEQAARGEWLFVNKFDPRPQRPFLFNAGWWAAGRLSAVLRVPIEVGWFAWGLVAAAVLVLGIRRMLALGGRAGAALDWGTVLVLIGSGLGWVRLLGGAPTAQIADLTFSFFPWMQLTAGAHGTLGTALLVWALTLHLEWLRQGRPRWRWIAAAWILGLSRPFDLATFLLVAAATSALDAGARRDRAWTDLAWLAPVLFYDGLAFALHPSFGGWSGRQNVVPLPGAGALAAALGPALALAAWAFARWRIDGTVRSTLAAWVLTAGLLLGSGLGFASQFATSLGPAVLLAVALGAPRRLLPGLALLLSPTTLVLWWSVVRPVPELFPPRDYRAAAMALAPECAPGDVVYGPGDPSLFVAGLTPCHTAFGHRVLTPDFAERAAESVIFFAEPTTAAWRSGRLARMGARFVMVPAGRKRWLAGTAFAPRWRFTGFEVWEAPPSRRVDSEAGPGG